MELKNKKLFQGHISFFTDSFNTVRKVYLVSMNDYEHNIQLYHWKEYLSQKKWGNLVLAVQFG